MKIPNSNKLALPSSTRNSQGIEINRRALSLFSSYTDFLCVDLILIILFVLYKLAITHVNFISSLSRFRTLIPPSFCVL
jgi:hypothetical protein